MTQKSMYSLTCVKKHKHFCLIRTAQTQKTEMQESGHNRYHWKE